jgi:hypothetical protein
MTNPIQLVAVAAIFICELHLFIYIYSQLLLKSLDNKHCILSLYRKSMLNVFI